MKTRVQVTSTTHTVEYDVTFILVEVCRSEVDLCALPLLIVVRAPVGYVKYTNTT